MKEDGDDGKDRAPDPEEALRERAVGHARNFGYFPTPDAVAERIADEALLERREGDPPLRCLEPSAGRGALAARMAKHGHRVDVVEVQAELAAELERSGAYARVRLADFLKLAPEPVDDPFRGTEGVTYCSTCHKHPGECGFGHCQRRGSVRMERRQGEVLLGVRMFCEFHSRKPWSSSGLIRVG